MTILLSIQYAALGWSDGYGRPRHGLWAAV